MRLIFSIMLYASLLTSYSTTAQTSNTGKGRTPDAYATPGKLVKLEDGRVLNLRCNGKGQPVVLLEAGGNSDSSTWYRVQPGLARLTKVCAYDRAGYGFSEGGPLPRDLDAFVADLHALIEAADITLPVVLVGHSLGSNIVRSYAQRNPQQVAGMLLVDPPEQGADSKVPESWQQQVAPMLAQRDGLLSTCEEAALAKDIETIEKRCLRQPPAWMSEQVASAMKSSKAKSWYWQTLRSEITSSTEMLSEQVPADESYGSIPLVLLRPTSQDEGVPDDVRTVLESVRRQTHTRILAASTQSTAVEVPDTSHDIQLDQPKAVISAVRRLLKRSGEK